MLPPRPIRFRVSLGRIAFLVHQQRVGQRTQYRLGVLPTDELQRPLRAGHEDRLVTDGTEVSGAVAVEQLEDLLGRRRASQAGDRRVGCGFIPVVHRGDERRASFVAWRDRRFVHRPHRPMALLHVAGLRVLEIVRRPEQRQPAFGFRRSHRGQMHRVDGQHRVELEPDRRARLHVPHTGQQQGGQQVAVRQTAAHAYGYFLQQACPRRVLQQPDQRLNFRPQRDDARQRLQIGGRHGRQAGQERQIAQTDRRAGGGHISQKTSTIARRQHETTSHLDKNCQAGYLYSLRLEAPVKQTEPNAPGGRDRRSSGFSEKPGF